MDLRDFKQQIKPYKAILGFDFGTKRLGVAVSDLLWTVATPQKTIFRSVGNAEPQSHSHTGSRKGSRRPRLRPAAANERRRRRHSQSRTKLCTKTGAGNSGCPTLFGTNVCPPKPWKIS